MPIRDDGWIGKGVRGVTLLLQLRNHNCYVRLSFQGDDRMERRDKIMELFQKPEHDYELQESAKFASIVFPVLDKGRKDREHWPEIREKLTAMGTDIYNNINESDA